MRNDQLVIMTKGKHANREKQYGEKERKNG